MKKILVVDDEKAIRNLLKRMLERMNMEVWVAKNGALALELCSRESFHLIISDYQMPQMDGRQLMERCRELMPQTPFILISGLFPETIGEFDNIYRVTKPFRVDELADTISALIDGMDIIEECKMQVLGPNADDWEQEAEPAEDDWEQETEPAEDLDERPERSFRTGGKTRTFKRLK